MLTGDRGLRQILMFAAHGHERVGHARERMRPAISRLVERAQAARPGPGRPELHRHPGPGVHARRQAAEYARGVRPDIWRRYLALMLDSLRPARDTFTPLPVPELSADELATAMRTSPLGQQLGSSRSVPLKPTAPGNTE